MKALAKATAVAITAAALSALLAAPVAAASGPVFIHGVLPLPLAGSTSKYNQAAEPQIRADQAGHFYISSENGLGAGTDAWSSTDAGHTYNSLPQPNEGSSTSGGTTGFAPGGGDTALATAPAKNSKGTYNVYVASLTVGSVTVSLSQNRGHTWANDVTSAKVPGDDREWIAAAGANGYYLSYHAIGAGDEIIVNQGLVAGGQPATVQTYDAINPAQTDIYLGTVEDNEIGNIAVDPKTGDVYQIFVGCPPSPTADGGAWAQASVTPAVHHGGVCQGGVTCTSNGNDNRDLYDDFGIAASPTTGMASITYSDDQYADNTGTANFGECTAAQNNTSACDHTDYATQTSGHGIY